MLFGGPREGRPGGPWAVAALSPGQLGTQMRVAYPRARVDPYLDLGVDYLRCLGVGYPLA